MSEETKPERFDMEMNSDWAEDGYSMVATPDGEYVTYKDHAAALASREGEVKRLRGALESLLFPNVPSADDLILLAIMPASTQARIDSIRPLIERLREAQANARTALKGATDGN